VSIREYDIEINDKGVARGDWIVLSAPYGFVRFRAAFREGDGDLTVIVEDRGTTRCYPWRSIEGSVGTLTRVRTSDCSEMDLDKFDGPGLRELIRVEILSEDDVSAYYGNEWWEETP
jgi:hypothetical protein